MVSTPAFYLKMGFYISYIIYLRMRRMLVKKMYWSDNVKYDVQFCRVIETFQFHVYS